MNNLLKYWHISLTIAIISPYNVTGKFIGLYKIVNANKSESIHSRNIFLRENCGKTAVSISILKRDLHPYSHKPLLETGRQ